MNMIEELILLLGISSDTFAVMECRGSLIATIEKKQLAAFCALLALGQAAALGTGASLSLLLCKHRMETHEAFLGQAVAAAIFLSLGIRLFLKAWQNERIIEHREEKPDLPAFAKPYVRTILSALLAGLAFGLLQCTVSSLLVTVAILTVLSAILGVFTGYHFGFEHKRKAYLAGGALLVAGGMDIMLPYLWNISSAGL
ncbi:MAG: hypothetical protein HFH38_14340 [Lachnospiraceae bacterium]|jgi:putative Mn2+ efflux pump MntP|nr:hypothetical protein [Lachnospiraceae bacterium]